MGGCVGKAKDFKTEEDAPVEAPPAPVAAEKVEAETVPEEKKEEPLVDLSEPATEAPKAEEATAAEAETKPVEEKAEAVEKEAAPKEEEAKKVAETA